MEIQKGINPNCSELVVRMEEYDRELIIKTLKKHGIKEVIVENFYEFLSEKNKDWDDQKIERNIKSTDGMTEKEIEKSISSNMGSSLMFIDESKTLNIEEDYNGTVYLSDHFDGSSYAFVGHQHCQVNMFPLLKKISDIFGQEVEPYDGGSTADYEDWISQGCPDPKEFKYSE
jgi:hypothetical protein